MCREKLHHRLLGGLVLVAARDLGVDPLGLSGDLVEQDRIEPPVHLHDEVLGLLDLVVLHPPAQPQEVHDVRAVVVQRVGLHEVLLRFGLLAGLHVHPPEVDLRAGQLRRQLLGLPVILLRLAELSPRGQPLPDRVGQLGVAGVDVLDPLHVRQGVLGFALANLQRRQQRQGIEMLRVRLQNLLDRGGHLLELPPLHQADALHQQRVVVVRVDLQRLVDALHAGLELPLAQRDQRPPDVHVRNALVQLGRQLQLGGRHARTVLRQRKERRRHVGGPVLLVHTLVGFLEVVVQDVARLLRRLPGRQDRVAVQDLSQRHEAGRVRAVLVRLDDLLHRLVDVDGLLLPPERFQQTAANENRLGRRRAQLVSGLRILQALFVLADEAQRLGHRDLPVGPRGCVGLDDLQRLDGLGVLALDRHRLAQPDRRRDAELLLRDEFLIPPRRRRVVARHIPITTLLKRLGGRLGRFGRLRRRLDDLLEDLLDGVDGRGAFRHRRDAPHRADNQNADQYDLRQSLLNSS